MKVNKVMLIGEVTSIEGEDDIQVNVMHPVQEIQKNLWKWPSVEDNIFYSCNNIVANISPPEPVGTGLRYFTITNFHLAPPFN